MPAERSAGPAAVGRRILVWGITGSGKTTFARRLAEALGLPAIELDAIRHARGWDSTPWQEFRQRLTQLLDGQEQGWVCDGSYSAAADVCLSRADTLVWLRPPWRVYAWRRLRRTLGRARSGERLFGPQGPREAFRRAFLSRRSILLWALQSLFMGERRVHRQLMLLPESVQLYELRSGQEVEAFLQAVEAVRPVGGACEGQRGAAGSGSCGVHRAAPSV